MDLSCPGYPYRPRVDVAEDMTSKYPVGRADIHASAAPYAVECVRVPGVLRHPAPSVVKNYHVHLPGDYLSNVIDGLVGCRRDQVNWPLVGELDDQLPKVSLYALHPPSLELMVEVNLLCRERLRLYYHVRVCPSRHLLHVVDHVPACSC